MISESRSLDVQVQKVPPSAPDRPAMPDVGELYERYADPILSYLRALAGSTLPNDLEDIVQDTFVKATCKLYALQAYPETPPKGVPRDPAKIDAWLRRVARNKLFDRLRQEQRSIFHGMDVLEVTNPDTGEVEIPGEENVLEPTWPQKFWTDPSWRLSPEAQVHLKEDEDWWTSRGFTLAPHLPQNQLRCVYLSFVGGLNDKEIAERLGIARSTVRVHISRGIASLRDRVAGKEKKRQRQVDEERTWTDVAAAYALAGKGMARAEATLNAGRAAWRKVCALGERPSRQDAAPHANNALRHFFEAGRFFEEQGSRVGQAKALLFSADVYRVFSHCDQAEALYEEARVLFSRIGSCHEEGGVFLGLGLLYQKTSRPAAARDAFLAAIDVFRRTGSTVDEGLALGALGELYLERGKGPARRTLKQAIEILHEAGQTKRARAYEGLLAATEKAGEPRQ